MTIHYDDKGKYFTEVVSTQTQPVIIQTRAHRIEGLVHIPPQERLKDILNEKEHFLAVTEAVVFGSDGTELYRSEFLLVNRDTIVWLIPNEETKKKAAEKGGKK